ncbi:MAG: IMP cyclohydrolase, partial [Oscillospiraceae bacterium]
YSPVRFIDGVTIVTNGDQTDTIYDFLKQGKSFEEALRTRTFEPDAPNYTPRISGVLNGFDYKLSILKSAGGNPDSVQRFFYEYNAPVAGEGHFIHTYACDGNPIPSFTGEPKAVAIDGDIDSFTARLWESLNGDNKVSLFVRFIRVDIGETKTRICNKNQ